LRVFRRTIIRHREDECIYAIATIDGQFMVYTTATIFCDCDGVITFIGVNIIEHFGKKRIIAANSTIVDNDFVAISAENTSEHNPSVVNYGITSNDIIGV